MSLTPLPAYIARANAAQAELETPKIRRAIAKYTEAKCREAYRLHSKDGEGASTIGVYLGLTTQQADAAIRAGEILSKT